MKDKLKVGDVIYKSHFGKIIKRMKITRVTAKYAFAKISDTYEKKFNREYRDGIVTVSPKSEYDTSRYLIETADIRDRFLKEIHVIFLMNTKWEDLPLDILRRVRRIVDR